MNLYKDIAYIISRFGYFNKEANLSVSVGSTTYPDITDCKVSIKRSSDDTVELTLKGLSNLNSSQTGRAMNLGDFTVTDVKVPALTIVFSRLKETLILLIPTTPQLPELFQVQ